MSAVNRRESTLPQNFFTGTLILVVASKKKQLIDGWMLTISPRKSEGMRSVFILNTEWPNL